MPLYADYDFRTMTATQFSAFISGQGANVLGWNERTTYPDCITLQNHPTVSGAKALRFYTRGNWVTSTWSWEPPEGKNRVLLEMGAGTAMFRPLRGTDNWYGWRWYLGTTWVPNSVQLTQPTLFQMKSPLAQGGIEIQTYCRGSDLKTRFQHAYRTETSGGYQWTTLADFMTTDLMGQWSNFVLHFVPHPSEGVIELWHNGVLKASRRNVNTIDYENQDTVAGSIINRAFHLGIYSGWDDTTWEKTMFVDRFKMGQNVTFADVDPSTDQPLLSGSLPIYAHYLTGLMKKRRCA